MPTTSQPAPDAIPDGHVLVKVIARGADKIATGERQPHESGAYDHDVTYPYGATFTTPDAHARHLEDRQLVVIV